MATPFALLGFGWGTHLGVTEPASIAPNRVVDWVVGTAGTNVQVVAGAARTGGYGLRLTASAATAHVGWRNTSQSPPGRLTGGVFVDSFWFRFPSALPTGDFNIWIAIGTGGGNDAFIKFLSSTGGLQAVLGASTQLGPTGIVADTWHHVDLKLVMNAGTQTLDWRIDGTAQTQVSLTATSQDLLVVGYSTENATNPGTMDIDDVVSSQTSADYPIGPHHVELLSVDPAGTLTVSGSTSNFNTFTANGTLAAWNATTARNNVDEVPPTISASADGFCQINVATTEYVQVPMTSYTLAGGEAVTAARMLACGWAASTSGATIGFRSWNGTTETTLYATANPTFTNSTTAPRWVCKMLTLADVNTQSELDALEFRVGFSGDALPDVGIHAIYAEVAVTEVAGTTVTLDQATETDTAQALSAAKQATLGQASEVDSALGLTLAKTVVLGLPIETDETFAIAASFGAGISLGQAAETDTALGLVAVKTVTLGLPGETDAALGATFTKTAALGQVTEVDEALELTVSTASGIALGQATETDAALPLTAAKVVVLGQAEETDAALNLSVDEQVALGIPSETDMAPAVSVAKTLVLGLPTEADLAQPMTAAKLVTLGLATELDEALLLVPPSPPAPETPIVTTVEPGGTTMTEPNTLTSVIEPNTLVSSVRS